VKALATRLHTFFFIKHYNAPLWLDDAIFLTALPFRLAYLELRFFSLVFFGKKRVVHGEVEGRFISYVGLHFILIFGCLAWIRNVVKDVALVKLTGAS